MGFLDGLFGGKSARRDIARNSQMAQASLDSARARAFDALQAGSGTARDDINTGLGAARGQLTRGYDTARGDLTTQAGRAEAAIGAGLAGARGELSPLISLGRRYDAGYADATGLNGQDARRAWIESNVGAGSGYAYGDELAAKQLQAKLNAAGITGGRSGALQLRQGAQRMEDRTNQLMDRYRMAGDRGAQYAGQSAGYGYDAGNRISGLRSGLGTQLAGLETGRGRDLAGAEAQAATTKAGLESGIGGSIAGLETNYGTQIASDIINRGNALGATRGQGTNALLQLGGLALKAYTPGASGYSMMDNLRGIRPPNLPRV